MRKFFTPKDFDDIVDVYFLWKKLNVLIKKVYTRGINLPEYITEGCVCYVNGYELTASEHGSEDAFDIKTNHKIQVKGTSNFNNDLSSFGPRSVFDELHFARLNLNEDKIYLYKIDIQNLYNVKVNSNQTFKQQQEQGRRPRFSLLNTFIIPNNIKEYCIVDLKNKKIVKYDNKSN